MAEEFVLSLEDISKKFPGVRALDHVNLSIRPGEIHAIVGENGAGKSTLMNILSGVYPPTEGRIVFQGQKIVLKDTHMAQELGISMIHQELSLASHLSVMENIFIGRLKRTRLGLVDYQGMKKLCGELMERIGLSQTESPILPQMLIKDLSLSQRQLVEITKAISLEARVLVMDEPTSSLTKSETGMLLTLMKTLSARGVSILFISHRLEEVFSTCDRISILRDGKHIQTLETEKTTIDDVVASMVGREMKSVMQRSRRHAVNTEHPLLEVRNLNQGQRLRNVCLTLHSGEVLALTGLVGAGRTELVQAIFGIDPYDSGEVLVDGKRLTPGSAPEAIRAGLGLVPEGRKEQGLFLNLSVKKNISMAKLAKTKGRLFLSSRNERNEARDSIERLKIKTPTMEQLIRNLSGGNQQKAIFARWLLTEPKILFLDEPTHGVDIGAKVEIYHIIDELVAKGMGVLLISSELPEVLTLADRILVMHQGSIKKELNRDDASQETIMHYATNQL